MKVAMSKSNSDNVILDTERSTDCFMILTGSSLETTDIPILTLQMPLVKNVVTNRSHTIGVNPSGETQE